MTTPALSYTTLKTLNPCTDSLRRVAKLMGGASKWDGKQVTAADARRAGATFEDIIWAASAIARTNADVERRLRLWMTDCAAHVLHIYEHDYPSDQRPRNAIIATRQCARGQIGAAAMAAAWDAARDAAGAAAWDAAGDAAWPAAMAAAGTAAGTAAWAAAGDAEEAWQFDRLVEWLGDKEPDDYPMPDRPVKEEAA